MEKIMKLKALLITTDGGRTWLIERQFYLSGMKGNSFLDEDLGGRTLKMEDNIDAKQPDPNLP